MAIGQLYNVNNIVVGQAAVFYAPGGTLLPDLDKFNLADPFDPTPFCAYTVTVGASTSYTLTINGVTSGSITAGSATLSSLQAVLDGLVGVGNSVVSGATPATSWSVVFTEGVIQFGFTATGSPTGIAIAAPTWASVGATDQGWQFGTNKSTQVINIEEQSTAIATTMSTQAVTIQGSLSEELGSLTAMALNGTLAYNAPTASVPGYEEINLTDAIKKYAVALVTQHFNGKPRIIYAPTWTQLTNTSVTFRRAAAKRMYPVVFTTVCKPSQVRYINILQPHS